MTDSQPVYQSSKTSVLIKRIFTSFITPYLGIIALATIFMMVAALLTAGLAQLFQPMFDNVLTSDNQGYVLPVAAALGGTFILRGIVSYIHTVLMNKASQSIVADIQKRLFDHLMTLDLSFFHRHPSGQLISRVISDVGIMRMAITDTMTGLIKSTLTLIFLVVVMFIQDWKLALFSIFVFPFAALFAAKLGRRLRKIAHSSQEELGNLSDRVVPDISGYPSSHGV
jgi:ABC-type multidrug transport system, ATPase and permease components